MNRNVLGVAMVVVFCITWWLVAGEAWQAVEPAKQAYQQAQQAVKPAEQVALQASQAFLQSPHHVAAQSYTRLNGNGNVQQALQVALQAESEGPLLASMRAQQAAQQAEQASLQAQQAAQQAEQASIMADAHWRTQASWGIGAGLLADVLLLVGALAWSKLTAKA